MTGDEIRNETEKAAEEIINEAEAAAETMEEAAEAAADAAGEAAEEASEAAEEAAEAAEEAAEAAEEAAETAENVAEEAEEDAESGKFRFFQRKPKKDKKDEKIEELTDRLARQMAEFDNYRKRTDKEKAATFDLGAKNVIEKLLPVLDNFERGFADADMDNPFVQGMDKIYKQFLTILEGLGVTPIEAKGKEFDLNFHNAVMHVEDETVGENIVVDEFQKGYMYKDTVVRHSMVKVAN
ncbi:MAG: nucleotide exchange factor GrpE [Eubacterium sp.]|nr:nucleotide exchange factor GrpE [Eubacterium sp.]